jgi:hypothetical protein
VGAASLLPLAACSLLLLDGRDYYGGVPFPGEGGAAESGSSTGPGEGDGGGSIRDAAVDGSDACAEANVLFCDDFDQGPLGARWTETRDASGTPRLDGTNVSPPSSALFTVANSGSTPEDSLLLRSLPPTNGLVVDCDLMIATRDNTAELGLIVVGLIPDPPGLEYYTVGIHQAESGQFLLTSFAQDSTTHQYVPNGAYEVFTADFSSFRHVTLDVTWGGSAPNVAVVSVDGVPLATHSLFAAQSKGENVAFGAADLTKSTTTWQIRFDNVKIRSK